MTPLVFNTQIAKGKPSNNDGCPFCDIEKLTGIIEKQNQFIWLENKYQTLLDTYLTLIIESSDHLGDITNYSYEYNRSLIHYAVDKWLKLDNSKQYRSVAMFKNFSTLCLVVVCAIPIYKLSALKKLIFIQKFIQKILLDYQ